MANEIRITESVDIKIPGVTLSKTFLHISDAHLTHSYDGDPENYIEFAEKHADRWNEDGIFPVDAFIQFIELSKASNPDAVIFAGDMIDYYTESNVKFLKELLADYPIETLYVWGNHEHGTYGLPIPEIKTMKDNISSLMKNDPDFWIRDYDEFIIVGLDNSNFHVTDNQIERFKSVIKCGKPIILLMHIPLMTDEFKKVAWSMFDSDESTTENAKKFSDMIQSEDSNVVAVITGHEHFAWSGPLKNGIMQYVSAPLFKRFVRKITVSGV